MITIRETIVVGFREQEHLRSANPLLRLRLKLRRALAVGIGIASNLFSEFWPDLKKRLPSSIASATARTAAEHPGSLGTSTRNPSGRSVAESQLRYARLSEGISAESVTLRKRVYRYLSDGSLPTRCASDSKVPASSVQSVQSKCGRRENRSKQTVNQKWNPMVPVTARGVT